MAEGNIRSKAVPASNPENQWLPFEEAREIVLSLKLKTVTEWVNYCKSGKKPTNIPVGPSRVYKNRGWKSWGFWLGTKRRRGEGWLPFEEARQLVQLLGLRSQKEWRKMMKDSKLPEGVPSNPEKFYKHQGWIGLFDFLGVGRMYIVYKSNLLFYYGNRT